MGVVLVSEPPSIKCPRCAFVLLDAATARARGEEIASKLTPDEKARRVRAAVQAVLDAALPPSLQRIPRARLDALDVDELNDLGARLLAGLLDPGQVA